MTASAGIAFIKQKAPFHTAYALSEELCGSAKRALRRSDGPTPSAVSFHRVVASAFRSLEEIRSLELSTPEVHGALTLAPYTLRDGHGCPTLEGLWAAENKRLSLPRGSLREWARLAQSDPLRADRALERIAEVNNEKWRKFEQALAALGCTRGPWTSTGHTPVFDLLNLSGIHALEKWS